MDVELSWPRPEPTRLDTDVLIVGGGVAGCLAAIEARGAGAAVLIADKAKFLERAGSVAGGVDQFMTPLNSGPEWDTPQHLMMHVPSLTDGLTDIDVAERAVHELPRVFQLLSNIGIDFTDAGTGEYFRTRAFGLPGEYHLNFDGSRFKYRLGRHTVGTGVKFAPRTMITDLVLDATRQRVAGALGFNCRTGERFLISAKAVVVATGDINRISRNISGMPFDSWHYPYNTGDGHAMAFRKGVKLVNMELVEATLTPMGFSTQGTNSYAGQGAYFVNRHGERFMFKYDPKGEKARRTMLVHGVIEEVLAGNEPICVDVRHLPPDLLEDFVEALGVDRYRRLAATGVPDAAGEAETQGVQGTPMSLLGNRRVDAAALRAAVGAVPDPEIGRPLAELGMLDDVEVARSGRITVRVRLTTPTCPLRRELATAVEAAARSVPGVTAVDVGFTAMTDSQRMRLAGDLRKGGSVGARGFGRGIPVYAVASGKGGVGKSTVTANIAAALAAAGKRVGVLDADVWGYSMPQLFGVRRAPVSLNGLMFPVDAYQVRLMSIGFFVQDDQPVVWRGPMLHKALQQFLDDVHWGDLDVLLVDLPPGTGDITISLLDFVPDARMLVVTTRSSPRTVSRPGLAGWRRTPECRWRASWRTCPAVCSARAAAVAWRANSTYRWWGRCRSIVSCAKRATREFPPCCAIPRQSPPASYAGWRLHCRCPGHRWSAGLCHCSPHNSSWATADRGHATCAPWELLVVCTAISRPKAPTAQTWRSWTG